MCESVKNLAVTGRRTPNAEHMVESANGVSLWTSAEGKGALAILLSAGGPGCPDYLAPLSALFGGPDRRVIRWEQRGTSRSGGDWDSSFTIAHCITWLMEPILSWHDENVATTRHAGVLCRGE